MFRLTIRTTNAAFGEPGDHDEGPELARLLAKIADALTDGARHGTVIDLNGARVGEWSLK